MGSMTLAGIIRQALTVLKNRYPLSPSLLSPRRYKHETSAQKISQHLKTGRKYVRRIERSLHNREDYLYVVEHAYGYNGRARRKLLATS